MTATAMYPPFCETTTGDDPRFVELAEAIRVFGDARYEVASGVDITTCEPLTIVTVVDRLVAAEQRVKAAIEALRASEAAS